MSGVPKYKNGGKSMFKNTCDYINQNEDILAWILLLPALLMIFGLIGYPFIRAVYLSFTESYLGLANKFIGIKNYINVFNNPTFKLAFLNTFIFTISAVIFKLIFGLAMAVTLNQKIPYRNLLRALYFLPWVTPGIVSVLTWKWMFSFNNGLINYLLLHLNILNEPVMWLGTRANALLALIITNVWRGIPFFGISILASLQTIPNDLYEVAKIDGANVFHSFIYVTLPSLKPIIILTLLGASPRGFLIHRTSPFYS